MRKILFDATVLLLAFSAGCNTGCAAFWTSVALAHGWWGERLLQSLVTLHASLAVACCCLAVTLRWVGEWSCDPEEDAE